MDLEISEDGGKTYRKLPPITKYWVMVKEPRFLKNFWREKGDLKKGKLIGIGPFTLN